MRNKFADTIYKLGKKDKRICALVADISPAGSMEKFRKRYPNRFINCGVAEQSMIGIASGLALRGMRPFCYTIATFALYRPFEMIRVDLGYQNLPVTVIGMGAGLVYSTLGGTHQSFEDISVACSIPNMQVFAPCDPKETEKMIEWCAKYNQGPAYMRLGKVGEPILTNKAIEKFKVGKIRKLFQNKHNADLAIISYGTIMNLAKDVYLEMIKKNSCSLYSCHSIKPLDEKRIKKILFEHKNLIVIEEHPQNGGLYSKILLVKEKLKLTTTSKILNFNTQDKFFHFYGNYNQLLDKHGISKKKVIKKILKEIY